MNLNLAYNSVGFYQLSKLACVPFVLVVQYFLYKQGVSRPIQLTLIPITVGVGWATVHDVDVNIMGTMFAVSAVAATGMAQIFTSTYQKSLNMNAMQLLFHTAPLIAAGMLMMCPVFDNVSDLWQFEYNSGVVTRIIVSCCFALGVNISNYVVLGKTSPLTYQVLGHLKTVLILVLGVVLFNKQVDMQNVLGVVVAMGGVVAYTEIKRRESEAPKLSVSSNSQENMSLTNKA
jgi:solute carrier family 35, member E3